jgi:hypothetical protein
MRTNVTRAALFNRLGSRLHELEMERLGKEITVKEYRTVKANLLRLVEAVKALAA